MAPLRALCLCLLLLPTVLQARERPDEYAVKAVYLYKIGLFVRWPDTAFADSTKPLVVGVIGRDPFGKKLDQALRGKTLAGRQIELRRYKSATELDTCHILFFGDSDRTKLDAALDSVRGRPTLTVGESEAFLEAGGALSFLVRNDQIRFRVNGKAAQSAGLGISSKLLQLSD